jgi:hypothetical protein
MPTAFIHSFLIFSTYISSQKGLIQLIPPTGYIYILTVTNMRKGLNKQGKPIAVKIVPEKKTRVAIFWGRLSIGWKIIGGVFFIIASILTTIQLYDRLNTQKEKPVVEKTARQKFDENYIDSTLKPAPLPNYKPYYVLESPPIFTSPIKDDYPIIKGIKLSGEKTFPFISLFLGRTLLIPLRKDLRKGIKLSLHMNMNCYPSYITFVERDNRIYVSTEFKSLMNEETIGIIDYNHWRLCKKELFDYHNTDDMLEVIDKQNQVVFSIKFQIGVAGTQGIYISGYFINPYAITILSFRGGEQNANGTISANGKQSIDTCLDKSIYNWKQKSAALISEIKTIFP